MEFEVSAELVSIYLEDAREQLAVLDDVLLRPDARERGRADGLGAGPAAHARGNSGMIGLPP
jgi:hypothetical protein